MKQDSSLEKLVTLILMNWKTLDLIFSVVVKLSTCYLEQNSVRQKSIYQRVQTLFWGINNERRKDFKNKNHKIVLKVESEFSLIQLLPSDLLPSEILNITKKKTNNWPWNFSYRHENPIAIKSKFSQKAYRPSYEQIFFVY